MTTHKHVRAAVLLWTILSGGFIRPTVTLSAPMPVQNVAWLIEHSNVICKGRIIDVREGSEGLSAPKEGPMMGEKKAVATLRVDKVLKGSVNSELIDVEFVISGAKPFATLTQNEYALWFLDGPSDADHQAYTLVEPYIAKLLVTSRISREESGLERDPVALVARELIASLKDDRRDVVLVASRQLGELRDGHAKQPLKELIKSTDREIQVSSYVALIRLGDYSVLEEAEQIVATAGLDEASQRSAEGVAHAIGEIRDHRAATQLLGLFDSGNALMRRSVTRALRFIRSTEAVERLVTALDDPDAIVRYNAVMGLAALEGKVREWAPALDVFQRNEETYLSEWKSWWVSEGRAKYSTR